MLAVALSDSKGDLKLMKDLAVAGLVPTGQIPTIFPFMTFITWMEHAIKQDQHSKDISEASQDHPLAFGE